MGEDGSHLSLVLATTDAQSAGRLSSFGMKLLPCIEHLHAFLTWFWLDHIQNSKAVHSDL